MPRTAPFFYTCPQPRHRRVLMHILALSSPNYRLTVVQCLCNFVLRGSLGILLSSPYTKTFDKLLIVHASSIAYLCTYAVSQSKLRMTMWFYLAMKSWRISHLEVILGLVIFPGVGRRANWDTDDFSTPQVCIAMLWLTLRAKVFLWLHQI